MNREIYQQQYDFELEQRNSIASSTNTPVVSLTIIGGALSSMILTFTYDIALVSIGFLIFVSLSILSAGTALTFIFRSVIGYSYEKIPSPIALSEHYENLRQWHQNNGGDQETVIQETEKDFNTYFEKQLSKAADHNGRNNIQRGNFIHDSTVAIAFSLAFMFVGSFFFIYAKLNYEDDAHKVEIINPVILSSEELIMAETEKSNNGDNSGSSSTQTPAAAPPQSAKPNKPSGPPNVVFKGSVDIGAIRDKNTEVFDGTNKKLNE